MSILEQLASHAVERTRLAKKQLPLSNLRQMALSLPKGTFPFEASLKKTELSFICECKKASPSRGVISHDFPYLKIAENYEKAGADAISVLTEPKLFLGNSLYLKEISEYVHIPCLRKDFIVDEYMIYESKILGASAILLICSLLSQKQIREYLEISETLGLSVLVEAHNEAEVEKALCAGATILGINNRNLHDFSIDTENSLRLRKQIPKNILFVSESGIRNTEDVKALRKIGADAVLIGEALMKARDKKRRLLELRGDL